MSGAFSVGHATDLAWDLPRLTAMRTSGYTEAVRSQSYHFNIPPDSWEDLTVDGRSIRRFHWAAPPANSVINVNMAVGVTVSSGLAPLDTRSPYPLRSVASDASPYLSLTRSLRLPASAQPLLRRFVSGATSEGTVVRRVANWIASHTRYDGSLANGPYDAAWVLTNHRATCQGFSSLMTALLRRLGIPSRVVYGWVSPTPIQVPGNGQTAIIQWATPGTAGTLHDWLNVYFPSSGWVAFDPQLEKFFVDPRHFAFLTLPDAATPSLGAWTAYPVGNQPIIGRPLRSGVTEIVPGDSLSTVTVRSVDTFQFRVRTLVRDVQGVRLFTR